MWGIACLTPHTQRLIPQFLSQCIIFYIYRKKMPAKKDAIAPEFHRIYIDAVKENDVLKALKKNTREFKKFLEKIPKKKIDFAYAKDKWSIRQLLQHIIDAERVFAYRALSFSRKDAASLPGFDENTWAANAKTSNRKWNDLVEEFKAVRKSTELLFSSFDDEQLLAVGTANNNNINTIALGFICAGHTIHHINICLLYTSPSPRDRTRSRMPSSA